MFGYPCELDELRAICERHGLALIEDAAEALGAEYKGAPLGSHGPSAVFGFYPNKQLATGEGGVVYTHSEEEWQLVRSLRNQGRAYEGGAWFHHVRLGFNYRWTDVQAAIGIGQLEKLDRLLELRAAAAALRRLLEGVEVEPLCADDADHRRSWFVYVVALPEGADRARVMAALRARRGSGRPSTSRASTCSRTCARLRLRARASARSPRTSRRARSPCRSTRSSRPRTRSASSTPCAPRSDALADEPAPNRHEVRDRPVAPRPGSVDREGGGSKPHPGCGEDWVLACAREHPPSRSRLAGTR